jgi:16S rRNA G966 N2-methylase RsmD
MDCRQYPGFSRVGLKALDYYFFKHRIKTKTKGLSFYDAMHDPSRVDHLDELIHRYKKVDPNKLDEIALQKHRYSVFQLYYGSVNQFRPSVAKWIYCTFKPKRILDFSAGWGGRCLAAMSLGIPYIGIDSNTHLSSAYNQLLRYESHPDVTMIFKPAEQVNLSNRVYDLIFTSPPYFQLEKYEGMKGYTKSTFLSEFFKPTVLHAWKHLQRGGHMILNMPEEMYLSIAKELPPLKQVLKLYLPDKHPKAASMRTTLDTKERTENMYVWKKTKNRTLKKR